MSTVLTPDIIISAYTQAYFPMAEDKHGEIYWHCPDPRAIIPLDKPKKAKSLRQSAKKYGFEYTRNRDFEFVIRACGDRKDTWISEEIIQNYSKLNKMGYAHSIECWSNDEIVGGLYGIAIGGAFFGESMFNTITDAAKASFYYLINHLKENGFVLLDSQYINPFTAKLGAVEISKAEYIKRLNHALSIPAKF
jgi:leucyl/phenylalanyl-tRNA--protein transferase